MSKGRVLLVDDDKAFVEATKILLEAEGYEILTAHNGETGLKMAKTLYPGLVILDVMMTSDTEGFDISRKIQDSPDLKGLPVILLTGIRKELKMPFGVEPDKNWLPVKTVLEKPVRPRNLLAEVRKYLKS